MHENGLKLNQLSRYATELVKEYDRMSLFVVGLGRSSCKEGRVEMVIGDMDI